MKPEELEQIKHNHRMEELGYERETELIRLETAWRLDNTTPQELQQQQQYQQPYPQQPIPQQPQYQPPTTPEEETPQEKSMKKFKGGKKK